MPSAAVCSRRTVISASVLLIVLATHSLLLRHVNVLPLDQGPAKAAGATRFIHGHDSLGVWNLVTRERTRHTDGIPIDLEPDGATRPTRPKDSSAQPVTLAFIGDTSLGVHSRRLLEFVHARGVSLVLHQGDLDYTRQPKKWDAQVSQVFGPCFGYYASMGNAEAPMWSEYAELLRRRHACRNGRPHVVCREEVLGRTACHVAGGLEFVLLNAGTFDSDVEGMRSFIDRSFSRTSIWKVCSLHKPLDDLQAGPRHGRRKDQAQIREVYETCRQHGAIVVAGHEHLYSRSHAVSSFVPPVGLAADPATPIALRRGRSVAVVNGLGGRDVTPTSAAKQQRTTGWLARAWPPSAPAGHHPPRMSMRDAEAVFGDAVTGALFCDFQHAGAIRQHEGLAANCSYVSVDGQVLDRFSLQSELQQ